MNVRDSSPNANAMNTRRGSSTPYTPSTTLGRPCRVASSRTRSACGERLKARAAISISSSLVGLALTRTQHAVELCRDVGRDGGTALLGAARARP